MKRLLCIWLPNWPIQRLGSQLIADGPDGGQSGGSPTASLSSGSPTASLSSGSPTASPGNLTQQQTTAQGQTAQGQTAQGQTAQGQTAQQQQPTVIWRADPRRGRLVVACCARAAAMGVRTGMPIAQAGELCSSASETAASRGDQATSPRHVAHKHDPVLDAQAIEQLATELQQHISPLVAVESLDAKPWAGQAIHAPDSLLCDITGVAHLFGGEAGLLKAAEEQLQRFGLRARLAIADSVGAAWALAHYRRGQRPKFDSHQDELTALPVEALRIPQTTVDTLTRLGVTRIDELLSLPRSGLATRLGNQLVRRIEQLLGEIEEPIEVHHAAAEQTHSCELEYPTDDCAILADRIAVVTEKVRAGLATRQRGALRIACCLALADHPPLTLEVGFFAPTLDAVHMSGLLVGCIENRHLPSSVTQITLSVALSGPLRSCQNSLFPQTPNAVANRVSNSSLSRMVDALSGRLGRDAVLGVSRSDDPLPEKAYQLTPLTGHADSGKAVAGSRRLPAPSLRSEQARSNTSHSKKHDRSSNNPSSADVVQPSADDALRRPLNLLDPPIPLSPIDRAAVSPDNPLPLGFRLGGKLHRIIRHWGPERIETGWWYGPSIRRDYYRVETDQGNWWWVFRNLTPPSSNSETLRPSWMLHGRFS